jgi:hypothetical protein
LTDAAQRFLDSTFESADGLLESLCFERELREELGDEMRGRLPRLQVDLLRAALVFTGAGLDATLKRLVEDTVRPLIDHGGPAEKAFKDYVRTLTEERIPNTVRQAVQHRDPRGVLVDHYVKRRTETSLLSTSEIRTTREVLGIPHSTITDVQIDALRGFLDARNEIAHRLDLKKPLSRGDHSRRDRRMTTVVRDCNAALDLAQRFIDATADLLGQTA